MLIKFLVCFVIYIIIIYIFTTINLKTIIMYYEIKNLLFNTIEGQFTTEHKALKYFNKYIYPKNIINNIKTQNFPESSFNLVELKKGINNWKIYTVK